MTLAVDFELPEEEMLRSVRAGRKILQAALDAKNGSTQAEMHCFGHSHIDIAWLWPLEETERKCARTFGSQLALMEEYPDFKFLQSQPHAYAMVKRLYPELYKRIKKAVKAGQWIPEGGMWVEPDTNITGGESLVRQFIHGKRFFKEEFGVDSQMMWLPDVFGYTGSLPQIMAGCGITCFSTQKIFWTYNGGDQFPYNIFWRGRRRYEGPLLHTQRLQLAHRAEGDHGALARTRPEGGLPQRASRAVRAWRRRRRADARPLGVPSSRTRSRGASEVRARASSRLFQVRRDGAHSDMGRRTLLPGASRHLHRPGEDQAGQPQERIRLARRGALGLRRNGLGQVQVPLGQSRRTLEAGPAQSVP
jgi:hypothetical protein